MLKGAREASIRSSSYGDIEGEVRHTLLCVGVENPQIVISPASIDADTPEVEIMVTIGVDEQNGFVLKHFFTGDMVRKLVYQRI